MERSIAIYTLTSELHNEEAVAAQTQEFLASLGLEYDFRGSDYGDYGRYALSLIFVRTGGTEGIFRRLLPTLLGKARHGFLLLTSGKSNSLAASMEILSFLRQQGIGGEIIHGRADYVRARVLLLAKASEALRRLQSVRLGIVGEPSDWLIASQADTERVKALLGIELIDIPMQELLDIIAETDEQPVAPTDWPAAEPAVGAALSGAIRIYDALRRLVQRHRLQGFTLRCFDLLSAVGNTGCLALARLNAQGLVAGCEGDVPAMLSMMVGRALTSVSGFQANPAAIDCSAGEILFAHCTIPLDMVQRYELDTHFESGIGVGIRGFLEPGPVTVFKLSGDLQRNFIAEGHLEGCQSASDLCRTQLRIVLSDKSQTNYFLTQPIGNHHIVLPGHRGAELQQLLHFMHQVPLD